MDPSCGSGCTKCYTCHWDYINTKSYKCCLFGCSKCYRAYTMRRFYVLAETDPLLKKLIAEKLESDLPVPDAVPVQVQKDRCGACNKKVGLLGFTCKCSGVFCGMHRYPEKHSCDFDYKTPGRLLIEKHNPLVVGDKLRNRV